MKESLWGYWIIVLGLFVLTVMILFQNYTTTNEQDYYLIKEVTEASLTDAIDLAHYRNYGELRIIKEKFVENFVRRFSETVNINKTYNIKFYDIYEAPPKVSVKVTTTTDTYSIAGDTDQLGVVTKLDAILETTASENTNVIPARVAPTSNSSNNILDEDKIDTNLVPDAKTPTSNNSDSKTESSVVNSSDGSLAKPAVIFQNLNQTFTGDGTTLSMSCACGPISLAMITTALGKSGTLGNYLNGLGIHWQNFTSNTSIQAGQQLAAGLLQSMRKAGLNNNAPGKCGGMGNYTTRLSSFVSNFGLKVTSASRGSNFYEKIKSAVTSGSYVLALVNAGVSSTSNDGIALTHSGHYITFYGYDSANGNLKFCEGIYRTGKSGYCREETKNNINRMIVEYTAISN